MLQQKLFQKMKAFYNINGVVVGKDVVKSQFVCDLVACKGACCTIPSDYGAPLLKEEVEPIRSVLPQVKELLPEQHRMIIEEEGFYETVDGELVTKSFNRRACVFVYYENEIAKCSIEKLYKAGEISVNKPVSCHLFPIRISNFGGDVLRYEKFSECKPAIENGKKHGVRIFEFCKDSLVRKYGEDWYKTLSDEVNNES
ncbi:MAG: DUF3109 family protein [Ignavibacteriaceae bacterium]|nr:DUF3109 family protein [Ignavibacteriaceae bacterium]